MRFGGLFFGNGFAALGLPNYLEADYCQRLKLHEFLRTLSMLIGGGALHQILGLIESTVSYTQEKGT